MFKKLKEKLGKKENKGILIGSPVEGESVSIKEVNDPTFSEEILGKGIAIKPSNGRVVAPVDGEITIMFKTKHAVSLVSEDGVEILIHVGLETVNLKGEHFKSYVDVGDKVKAGDLLVEFDLEKIKEAGYDTTTPIVICNTPEFSNILDIKVGQVKKLDKVIEAIR
ncbi:PTS sugar transporter subunit IIA [[Clostridium] dakarense]|uniref:PTS sugar transporter subunit IIA n=1 Tax=Faecalimicrobium dakarense TaxID=1301100 RepID=UPI0004BBD808|nr:PTS glucose transporter subunit IIA [[Clostridium] dakarense]